MEAGQGPGGASAAIGLEPDGAPTQEAVRRAVLDGLLAHNHGFVSPAAPAGLVLAARAPDGTLVGGLVGETQWAHTGRGWLQVALLWVAEAARGHGLGGRLLARAEEEAARRGCRHVAVDTYEFQARPFYERAGYTVFGVQENYPPGHRRYFLRKTLVAVGGDADHAPPPAAPRRAG